MFTVNLLPFVFIKSKSYNKIMLHCIFFVCCLRCHDCYIVNQFIMQCSMHKKWIALGCTRQVSQVRVVKRCNLTLSELQLNIVSGVSSDADWCYLGLVSRPEQQWSQDQWSPNTSQFSACSPGRHMSVRMEE